MMLLQHAWNSMQSCLRRRELRVLLLVDVETAVKEIKFLHVMLVDTLRQLVGS